jgi:hypothetical protein
MKQIAAVLFLTLMPAAVFSGCAERKLAAQAPELLEPVGVEADTAIAYKARFAG